MSSTRLSRPFRTSRRRSPVDAGLRRRTSALAALIIVFTALVSLACYEDPQKRMDEMQLVVDMEDAVNALNAQTSELIFTVDSLRRVVAKQDTAIMRLANLAGVPY